MKPIELFKQAKRIQKEMNRSAELARLDANKAHDSLYYENEAKLKVVLKSLLRSRFDELNKIQLLELLDLCSTYRPVEPFQVLVAVSLKLDARKGE